MKSMLNAVQQRIEQKLTMALTPLLAVDERLANAMIYGVCNGGKRLRPFLVYATADALGSDWDQADAAAIALEMVHSYSLIHDDLPAMDDDDLRRGKPTCHRAFDEATAILAGDGLLTMAFDVLANAPLPSAQRVKLIQILAQTAGAMGMVAGQSIDLNHVGKAMSLAELERMHRHKTGALIRAAVQMGAVVAQQQPSATLVAALLDYADAVGLAFQVRDDILDVEGDTRLLGKHSGVDVALNKPTYPALLGLRGAKDKAQLLLEDALCALEQVPGDTQRLAELAHYIVSRDH